MEEHEREKIIKLLPDLLKVTFCHVMMIAELESRGVLSFSERVELESIRNEVDRVNLMYQILQNRKNGYNVLVSCLKETNQTGALKILERDFEALEITTEKYLGAPTSQQYIHAHDKVKLYEELVHQTRNTFSLQEKVIFFNVRNPTKLFTGRVKQLEELKSTFIKGGEKAVISQNSSITGLGGIGKTELAKMFINSIDFAVDEPQFNTIVWINAESVSSLNQDFKIFATNKLQLSIMNVDNKELAISAILDKIYERLGNRKSLIVFDNAEDTDILNEYMPNSIMQGNENTSILITSQSSNWDTEDSIRLSGLEEAEAIDFVKKGLGLSLTLDETLENQIGKLVSRLQYFPLAISQAIAFIKDRKKVRKNYGPEDYINDLDSKAKLLLTKPLTGTGTSYKLTIYQTVELTMEKINEDPYCGAEATTLLKLMAYMSPENIADKMFVNLFDEIRLDTALIVLEKFSVVHFYPREENEPLQVNIHRLVQEILQIILETRDEAKHFLAKNLELAASYLNPETVDHALSVWKFASTNLDLMKQFSRQHTAIAQVLINSGRLNDAMSFVSGQLERLEGLCGNENSEPVVINLQIIIGLVMFYQSRYEECKDHLSKILCNSNLTKSDPIMVNCRYSYAEALVVLNKFEEALENFEAIYQETINTENGKESSESVKVLNSIAQLYRMVKKFDESVATCEKIIEAANNDNSIISYREVVVAKCNLAVARSQLGNKELCLEEYREACECAGSHFHPNDGMLLDIRRNLAVLLYQAGQFEVALELNKKVYESFVNRYGCNHEKSLNAKQGIIWCQTGLGVYNDELLSEAVEIYQGLKGIYGENYYDAWRAYELVGRIFASLGRAEEGRFVLLKCLGSETLMKMISVGRLYYLKYYLAVCLELLGNFEEALDILDNIMEDMCCQKYETETDEFLPKARDAVERLKLKLARGKSDTNVFSE